MSSPTDSPTVAYLAGGQVHVLGGTGRRSFQSEFGEKYQDRALSIHRRNAWKLGGQGALFLTGGLAPLVAEEAVKAEIAITSMARDEYGPDECGRGELVRDELAPDGQARDPGVERLLYSLRADRVTGVFRLDPATGAEQRLFHSNEHVVTSLAPQLGGSGKVACSVRAATGTANLALIDTEEGGLVELTEGDSVDETPSWVEGKPHLLLYQSAGVARNEQGLVVAHGPRAIQRLDLERGEVEEIAAEDQHDLLAPKMRADGTLFFIRRPFRRERGASSLEVLRGLLLFPFHFVMMFFHIVNNYTRSYSKKPMLKAGTQEREVDERLMIWGQLVDFTEKAKGRPAHAQSEDEQGLVPPTWELVRCDPDGASEVIARGVLSFDLARDGQVVWSDGRSIWTSNGTADRIRLGKGGGITQVIVLG